MSDLKNSEIIVHSSGFPYRVLIERESLARIGKDLRMLFPATRALLVSDSKVYSLYGQQVLQALAAEKWQVTVVQIQPGERSKNLTRAARIYDAALDAGLDRNSPVIALGGGVVGDLAGFVAATFMRGLPLVMLPTSLLAQVDSSVGGKVAVNHPRAKNIIGSIYPPRLVMIDPAVLQTLPPRQLKAGLAEVIKYGMIVDGAFFERLENTLPQMLQGNLERLSEAVIASVRAKAQVVGEDEFERDYRRILNFGHTFGHALEAATSYRYYLHGEAVLVGMAAAVSLALSLGLVDVRPAERMLALIKKIGLKKAPSHLTATAVIDKLRQDKKRINEDLIFVLPRQIGLVEMIPVRDVKLIETAIRPYLG